VIEPELHAALEMLHPGASIDSEPGTSVTRVVVRDGSGVVARYVVLSLPAERGRADQFGRATRIIRSGLLRSLPSGVASGVAEVVETAAGEQLILALDLPRAGDAACTGDAASAVVVALARMHAAFAGFPARLTSGLGLLPLGMWLGRNRPGPDAGHAINDGWQAFAGRSPSSWAVVEPLLANPAPLVDALRDCQPTIVQGNPAPAELSFGDDVVIFYDWGLATRGPGALDLGAFVAAAWPSGDQTIDRCVEVYRAERARLGRLPAGGERWEREAALGLLAGVLVSGWALAARPGTIDEWAAAVAAGQAALG